MPAKAGIQRLETLDPGFRRGDSGPPFPRRITGAIVRFSFVG